MNANPRLIVYGNSVFLAGINAQLEQTTSLELITIESAYSDVVDQVRACRPQAVLFDVAMDYPDFAVALLYEQPGLLLIGVNSNSNELLVLSGQREQAMTVADLVHVIQQKSSSFEPIER